MIDNNINGFPSQKRSFKEKNDKWYRDCVDSAERIAIFGDEKIRQSYYNKKANYDLANDVLNTEDVEKITNPFKIQGITFPAKMQNYPIANPKIDLLLGEESKRRFDWRVRVINDDAISEKEEMVKGKINQFFVDKLKEAQLDEEQMKVELEKLSKWKKYEAQDFRELAGTQILKHLWYEQDLDTKFNAGFQDALIASEEIYAIEIVAGEPIVRRCNPLNIFTVRSGESPYIEDSDIIIESGYVSPGSIIDECYEYLTPSQIDLITRGFTSGNSGSNFINIGQREPNLPVGAMMNSDDMGIKPLINLDTIGFGGATDSFGNVRMTKVCWRGLRKIGKLSYFDEDGTEQIEIVDEGFPIAKFKDLGWSIEWLWINEWYQAKKIGGNTDTESGIYIDMKPKEVQFRHMSNLSKCAPGYVGTIYNINNSKGMSLMDRMKPYQYLYNAFMYRTELAFAKYKGPIYELDLAKIPEHWALDDWMYYAEAMSWGVVDSFKEGTSGQATGKLAGNFNTSGKVLDANMGNYIQQNIQFLQYIEQQLGEIAGVTKQRQGQISSSELVGNTERAVTQSSHITEKWFKSHDNLKLRVLQSLLETAKFAWRGNKKKLQYVGSDMATEIYNIDGETMREVDFGISITNGSNDMELLNSMKQLAHAGIQNDKINFSQLIDIMTTDSISSIRRKIETAEEKAIERQQQAEQAQQEHEKQMQQAQTEAQARLQQMQIDNREDEQMFELEKQANESDLQLALKDLDIFIKKMEIEANKEGSDNGAKLQIELEKMRSTLAMKDKERRDKLRLKEEELSHKRESGEKDRQAKLSTEEKKLKLEKEFKEKDLKDKKEQAEKDRKQADKHKRLELEVKKTIETRKARLKKPTS